MNTNFMRIATYIFFGVMFFSSNKDLKNFKKNEYDLHSDKNEIIKYIHRCEVRIGIILFFIMLNILAMAVQISK
ncbi:hypothetical protein [Clostridium sp. UBA6640]|uniref:hypothetical protein n=1 Tax=Clostridium sp. UBA6640 TaxID=1946370 RepID=UPI0025C31F09|nr:hypothetical protein [Clostridium sp. UBA6640]